MIDTGWYVLTICLAVGCFFAGCLLGYHPIYRDRPEPKGSYCPGFWERLYYQQYIKDRPIEELANDGQALTEFIDKLEKIKQ